MSKNRVLNDIRRSLGRTSALDNTITKTLEQRMQDVGSRQLPREQRPAIDSDLYVEFERQLHIAGATVQRVVSPAQTVDAIAAFRQDHALAGDIVINEDEVASQLPFQPDVSVSRQPVGNADELSVTGAVCAIAETGSIVVRSGSHNATRSSFLPDNHIVVVHRSQLIEHLEDVWPLTLDEAQRLPRSVNLITGPSKTADVEQTLEHGAHGPKRLHVIVVDDNP